MASLKHSHLASLSEELLLIIVAELDDEVSDLCNVALVSRRLYGPAIRSLYKHVCLDTSPGQFDGFSSSVQCNTALRLFVKELDLRWMEPDDDVDPTLESDSIGRLVSSLSALRIFRLTIEKDQVSDEDTQFRLPRDCQYDLTIFGCIAAANLPSLFSQSMVSHLTVPSFREPSEPLMIPAETCLYTAPIQSLDLGGIACMNPISLRSILTLPRCLKRLCCVVPVTRAVIGLHRQIRQALSPAWMVYALESVQTSLEELELYIWELVWPGRDGSRLNLRRFQALKNVELPCQLLFNAPRPSISRNGVWENLPAALQRIRVSD